jgi:hypothetical protein
VLAADLAVRSERLKERGEQKPDDITPEDLIVIRPQIILGAREEKNASR